MKKIKSTLLLLVIFYTAFSQSVFNDFPVLWQGSTVKVWTLGPGHQQSDYYYSNYYLIRDSISNNDTSFHSLYYSTDTVFNIENISFYNYLVDINNKVFIGNSKSDLNLVLDFNLNPADSFCFKAEEPFWLKVITTDSVMVGPTKRKRITFESLPNRYPLVWIQGIGDVSYGRHFTTYQTLIALSFFHSGLDCYMEYSNQIWGEYCRLTEDTDDIDFGEHNFIVYPNPTLGEIIISSKNEEIFKVEVYDLSGSHFNSFEVQNQELFDISTYPSGIYIFILDNTYTREVYKIIKQ